MLSVDSYDEAAMRLAAYGASFCQQWPVPGGVVAIVNRDGGFAEAAWGFADAAARSPMRPEAKFEIGSISKAFTSLLIHALAEEGLVDLDAPAQTYLPWLVVGQPDEPVTLRQLMSHTAGLIAGGDHLPDERAQVWSMRERTRVAAGDFHYSNLGYMVLGQVIEAVTGHPLSESLRRAVLSRMGMADARVGVVHADREVMATGHWPLHDDRPWLPGDPVAPATWFEVACADGNIAASARELTQFVRLLLADGEVDGKRIVKSESVRAMVTPTAPMGEPVLDWPGLPSVDSSRYALGLNVESIGSHTIVTHGGGMVGYATFMLADLTSGVGVVVLTNGNGDYPAAQVIARAAHAMLLGGIDTRSPSPDLRVLAGELSPAQLGDFASPALSLRFAETGTRVQVERNGRRYDLLRTFGGRYVIADEELRRWHLYPQADGWSWGGERLQRVGTQDHNAPGRHALADALVGHYRCFSPWYPNFRIVAHSGSLFLVAPGGIEAHADECELVEVSPGVLRIGASAEFPERITMGPIVEGRAVWLERDGAVYSRAFTE